MFQSEVEDTLKRIQSHKGVQGLIVVNSEGTAWLIESKYMKTALIALLSSYNNNNGFICIAAWMLDYTISAMQGSAYII